MQFVSKLTIKIVKTFCPCLMLTIKMGSKTKPHTQFQKHELSLLSQLSGKLFRLHSDFWNKVWFWFYRLLWLVPHYLHITRPNISGGPYGNFLQFCFSGSQGGSTPVSGKLYSTCFGQLLGFPFFF